MVSVYVKKGDTFEGSDLGEHRVYTVLNNKSTLLKVLPATENAYNISNALRWQLQSTRVLTFARRMYNHVRTTGGQLITVASAIDAPSLATAHDAYDLLWLHQGL